MNEEEAFQGALDEHPEDMTTRLVFAGWLEERDDPRAEGYQALARQKRYPIRNRTRHGDEWWWYCGAEDHSHRIPPDWFALLPPGVGNEMFWPARTDDARGVKSRRECEDALALAFAQLPAGRREELLKPPA